MAEKKQNYIVTLGNTIATDTERWGPGSLISLSDQRAAAYLEKGIVIPADTTKIPQITKVTEVIVHPQAAEKEI